MKDITPHIAIVGGGTAGIILRHDAGSVSRALGPEFSLREETRETHKTPWGQRTALRVFPLHLGPGHVKAEHEGLGAVRFSLGRGETQEEIDYVLNLVQTRLLA